MLQFKFVHSKFTYGAPCGSQQDMVISQMYAAVDVANYLIGSGTCVVSQFIAHLLGGKHMIGGLILDYHAEDIILDIYTAHIHSNSTQPPDDAGGGHCRQKV